MNGSVRDLYTECTDTPGIPTVMSSTVTCLHTDMLITFYILPYKNSDTIFVVRTFSYKGHTSNFGHCIV